MTGHVEAKVRPLKDPSLWIADNFVYISFPDTYLLVLLIVIRGISHRVFLHVA